MKDTSVCGVMRKVKPFSQQNQFNNIWLTKGIVRCYTMVMPFLNMQITMITGMKLAAVVVIIIIIVMTGLFHIYQVYGSKAKQKLGARNNLKLI